MAPYPTKSEIEELASHLATDNPAPFFDRVSPNVVWDVMGVSQKPSLRNDISALQSQCTKVQLIQD